ncbi:MAG: hypothetical protein NTV61_10705 [Candidatus Bathyarchaeota archaeon]|nr:hypothetical protein [Candidatus Bathyarchaeota archaeon]
MNKKLFSMVVLAVLALVPVFAAQAKGTGFDEFGYNYQARIFSGPADGVDRVLDGKVWGDPTYANDHLVMKWSKAWDDARFNGALWTPDAWCTNEWNGHVAGGSGESETFKCIWVGPALEASPYWRPGGYAIWGEFEAIMDHYGGLGAGGWFAHAIPCGLGGK